MCVNVEKFEYRKRFARFISSGPKAKALNSGTVVCHQCGTEEHVVINEWVKTHCPPSELLPLDSLHWQATFDGWAIAPMQVYAGDRLLEWPLTLCPSCVDKWLAHVGHQSQSLAGAVK